MRRFSTGAIAEPDPPPPPSSAPARALAPAAAVVVAGVLTAVAAVRTLLLVGFRLVDEDLAIYWYAAQEFALLRFREPFFYGQAYHHLGEALLAAPFVAMGVPLWIAVPASAMAVGLAPWAILAWLAWRRGALALAVLVAGAPALMPAGYGILLTRTFGMGILAAALALLAAERLVSSARWVLVGFLLALGVATIGSTALLAAPALAWLALTSLRTRQAWALTAVGLAAGAGLHLLGREFYVLNPGWVVHPSPRMDYDVSLLADALRDLPRHLRRVTPAALGHPAVPLVGVLVTIAVAARRRRGSAAWPGAIVLAITLAALGLEKVHDGDPSVFFAYERMFLALPPALALVALSAVGPLWSGGASGRAAVACAAGVLVLAGVNQVGLAGAISAERAVPKLRLTVHDVGDLRRECRALEQAAHETGTGLAVFLRDATRAYACAALSYERLETLFPEYERRTWLLLGEQSRARDGLLLYGVTPDADCPALEWAIAGARCVPVGPQTAAVRFPPHSALDLLRALGLYVRRF